MTISTTSSIATFAGNGSTTDFDFEFVGDNADDIVIQYTDADGNITTLNPAVYDITLNTTPVGGLWGIGGTVSYPLVGSAIASGTYLTVIREVPYTQDISIGNQGNFYPSAIEQGLDILELQIQQLEDILSHTIKTPLADVSPPADLPSAAVRANHYFAFDQNGDPVVAAEPQIVTNSTLPTVATIAALRAMTVSVSLVGSIVYVNNYSVVGDKGGGPFRVTQTNPGAENYGTIIWSNTAGFYFVRETSGADLNVAWFGAVGDSTTDDIIAIRRAIIAAYNSRVTGANGAIRVGLEFPVGVYKITDWLPMITSVNLYCLTDFGAVILPTFSAAYYICTATLSGTTFTQNTATSPTLNAIGASIENFFINTQTANGTPSNTIMYVGGAGEGRIRNVFISSDTNVPLYCNIDHCPNFQLDKLSFQRTPNSYASIGLTVAGQSNQIVLNNLQFQGKFNIATLVGGSGLTIDGGDFEGNPAIAIQVTGENTAITHCWFENPINCITLGSSGASARSTTIDDNTFAGTSTTYLDIISASGFHWGLGNSSPAGSIVTNKFNSVASAGDSNGVIEIFDEVETFTTAGINLSSKGAIVVNVYGGNQSGDQNRFGQWSTETNRRLTDIKTILTVATLPTNISYGVRALVDDANATTYRSIVAGGGANRVSVYYDGTDWRIG